MREAVSICWFRRDLRLEDHHALSHALQGDYPLIPLFIFDDDIIGELEEDDPRVWFIYKQLEGLDQTLGEYGSGFLIRRGKPEVVWTELLQQYDVKAVYSNEDYEAYGIKRDTTIRNMVTANGATFNTFQDHVIFKPGDILKADGTPYTVYTPFKRRWLEAFSKVDLMYHDTSSIGHCMQRSEDFPSPDSIGIKASNIKVEAYDISALSTYGETRDYPAKNSTSRLGPHLRFGTVSVRQVVQDAKPHDVFLSELIWREFFIHILWHFPHVVHGSFRPKYDSIPWRNDASEFERWKSGTTGYPIVDAGMRELNATGFMHNRVRMIVASFLCKHLLIDWRWGEAYFASKLLDFELASNNGNWQWAAGTGCDAAPYFRVFNPSAQTKRFDGQLDYIKKWVPELNSLNYPSPMVEHKSARLRALDTYKKGLSL